MKQNLKISIEAYLLNYKLFTHIFTSILQKCSSYKFINTLYIYSIFSLNILILSPSLKLIIHFIIAFDDQANNNQRYHSTKSENYVLLGFQINKHLWCNRRSIIYALICRGRCEWHHIFDEIWNHGTRSKSFWDREDTRQRGHLLTMLNYLGQELFLRFRYGH